MKKIILAAIATTIGTSAFAGPLVFSNGVQLTDVQIVERQKEGKLPAIVGNSFYEDGKFVMASDSKNPTVRKVQKVREAIRERQENQDQKRIDRAPAEAARAAAYKAAVEAAEARKAAYEEFLNSPLEWSEAAAEVLNYGINYSLDNEPYYKEGKGLEEANAYKEIIANLTHGSAAAGYNEFYGDKYGNITAEDVQQTVAAINALENSIGFEDAIKEVRGAITYAFKITSGGYDNFDKLGSDYD